MRTNEKIKIISGILIWIIFYFAISGNDCAAHTIDGDRADTAEGARVQVHLQHPSSKGKNRLIHPLADQNGKRESRVIITPVIATLWCLRLLREDAFNPSVFNYELFYERIFSQFNLKEIFISNLSYISYKKKIKTHENYKI